MRCIPVYLHCLIRDLSDGREIAQKRKNHRKRDNEKPPKKGLFSKVAKVTRVLHAFKSKKVVHKVAENEPKNVHLKPIHSSSSGLVCHFSKVNYLNSTCIFFFEKLRVRIPILETLFFKSPE